MSQQQNQDYQAAISLIINYMRLCRAPPYNSGILNILPTRDDVLNFIDCLFGKHIIDVIRSEEINYYQQLQQQYMYQQQMQQQIQQSQTNVSTIDDLFQMLSQVRNRDQHQSLNEMLRETFPNDYSFQQKEHPFGKKDDDTK